MVEKNELNIDLTELNLDKLENFIIFLTEKLSTDLMFTSDDSEHNKKIKYYLDLLENYITKIDNNISDNNNVLEFLKNDSFFKDLINKPIIKSNTSKNSNIDKLNNDIKELENKNICLNKEIEKLNNDKSQIIKQLDILTNEKDNLSNINKDYSLKISNLNKEIDGLKINNITTIEKYENNINDLKYTINNQELLNINLNDTLRFKENENKLFEENINKLNNKVKKLEDTNNELNISLDQKNLIIDQLNNNIKDKSKDSIEKIKELEQKISDLKLVNKNNNSFNNYNHFSDLKISTVNLSLTNASDEKIKKDNINTNVLNDDFNQSNILKSEKEINNINSGFLSNTINLNSFISESKSKIKNKKYDLDSLNNFDNNLNSYNTYINKTKNKKHSDYDYNNIQTKFNSLYISKCYIITIKFKIANLTEKDLLSSFERITNDKTIKNKLIFILYEIDKKSSNGSNENIKNLENICDIYYIFDNPNFNFIKQLTADRFPVKSALDNKNYIPEFFLKEKLNNNIYENLKTKLGKNIKFYYFSKP